jgi:ribosomal protein S18 acetylase RimI-like enzyme
MTIRPAQTSDASSLSNLGIKVFSETYGFKIPPNILRTHLQENLSIESFRNSLNASENFFVAEIEDSLIGFIRLRKYTKGILELDKFYVSSDYHGQGVAKKLFEAGLEWARTQGFHTMRLVVWKENSRAVRFYQKNGFVVCGQQDVYIDRIVFDDYVMQKEIL